jgi:hypothetical protein
MIGIYERLEAEAPFLEYCIRLWMVSSAEYEVIGRTQYFYVWP